MGLWKKFLFRNYSRQGVIMAWKEEIFDFDVDDGTKGKIVVLNIGVIDADIEKMINDTIVSICFGDSVFSIDYAKEYIKNYLNTTDEERKKGAISEFFVHLYLKSKGLKQECLYTNLEENSPKKGFDGVYSTKTKVWYMESKSGSNINAEHKDKVGEAYRDLKNKFEGNVSNNPWLNAYNHAKAVDATGELVEMFSNLAMSFSKESHDIREFNIIPCGTLFWDDTTKENDSIKIKDAVANYLKKKSFAKVVGICISQKAMSEFENFLGR